MLKERNGGRNKQAGEMGTIGFVKNYKPHLRDNATLLPYFRKRRNANKHVLKGIIINGKWKKNLRKQNRR